MIRSDLMLLLLLFSRQLMATMQSVVVGQVPITLERKITSGGKQLITEDNTQNNTYLKQIVLYYASDENEKMTSAYVRIRYIHVSCVMCHTWYAKRVATETETEETP